MRQWFLLVPLSGLLIGCQPSASTDQLPASPPAAPPQRPPFRLAGTWVRHEKGSFTLAEIDADSGGTYTHFLDYRKELADSWKPGYQHYFLYKSPLQVKCPQPGYVALHTRKFRFDYEEAGDTLREFDKMGPQGKLVRLSPARY